jgi:hypothetical protein
MLKSQHIFYYCVGFFLQEGLYNPCYAILFLPDFLHNIIIYNSLDVNQREIFLRYVAL